MGGGCCPGTDRLFRTLKGQDQEVFRPMDSSMGEDSAVRFAWPAGDPSMRPKSSSLWEQWWA